MKTILSIKKSAAFIVIGAILTSSLAGCVQKSDKPNASNAGKTSDPVKIEIPAEGKGSGTIKQEPAKKETPKTQDKDLTQNLAKEKEVMGGQVYVQSDMVILAMNIKPEVTKAQADSLAARYMDQLKKKYQGKAINIQAVQNKKNIVNLLYDPKQK